jgi:Icc-related predicted phosphoesterase
MNCLFFSDVHGDHAALERLMRIEADLYFALGDTVSWGRGLDRCGEILKQRAGKVYVLPGNHESAQQISQFCQKFGFHNFHQQIVTVAGFHIAGLGYSCPTPFHTPGEYSEEEIAQKLSQFRDLKPLVLACHCPPFGTSLDRVRNGVHAGSRSVMEFIHAHQPLYFFCGHIHEAQGISALLGTTRAFNVGPSGYLLDLDKITI